MRCAAVRGLDSGRCGGEEPAAEVPPNNSPQSHGKIRKIKKNMAAGSAWQILSEQGLGHGGCLSLAASRCPMMFGMPVCRRNVRPDGSKAPG